MIPENTDLCATHMQSYPLAKDAEPEYVGLWYHEDENVFVDDDGQVVECLSEIVRPNDRLLFRESMDYLVVPHRSQKGVFVEMYAPDGSEDWDGNPDTVCDYCNERNHPLCDTIDYYD